MGIQSDRNLYPGINIHLNNYLQNTPGMWQSFHTDHITHLREAFDTFLPPGYFTLAEPSLQLKESDDDSPLIFSRRSRTEPDVLLLRERGAAFSPAAPVAVPAVPTVSLPILETLEDEDVLNSLVVYQIDETQLPGKPVTRVELLSPGNKPGGAHFERYIVKRLDTLKSGLCLVEMDYLHQSPPVLRRLPRYPKEAGSAPFMILVNDPTPTLEDGTTAIYAIGAVDPLPAINIPLAGKDVVKIDFGAVYHHTVASSRFFRSHTDYAQDPIRLDTFSADDQALLQKQLKAIREQSR